MPTNKDTILVALFYNLNFFIFNLVNSLFSYNEYMYMKELMAKQLDSISTTFPTQIITIFSIPLLWSTLKTKSWSKLVKVSRTWSPGQISHKWSSDQLRIICAISHLSNWFMVSVN